MCQERDASISTFVAGPRVKIAVSDTGKGIDKGLVDSLFERPHVLDPTGRGRGAHIARLIVKIYGGMIEVEGPKDVGATLTAWLPLESRR